MRYVSTATSIQTALEQFRFDWDKLRVSLGGKTPAPGSDSIDQPDRGIQLPPREDWSKERPRLGWLTSNKICLSLKSTAAALETERSNVQAAQKAADDERKAAQQKAED